MVVGSELSTCGVETGRCTNERSLPCAVSTTNLPLSWCVGRSSLTRISVNNILTPKQEGSRHEYLSCHHRGTASHNLNVDRNRPSPGRVVGLERALRHDTTSSATRIRDPTHHRPLTKRTSYEFWPVVMVRTPSLSPRCEIVVSYLHLPRPAVDHRRRTFPRGHQSRMGPRRQHDRYRQPLLRRHGAA